ncbi:Peroxidase [Carabus blaptoides fortunei]
MVTIRHPICSPPKNCEGNHWYAYDDDEPPLSVEEVVKEPLPPLKPGSPAFAHFQSVRSDDTPPLPEEDEKFGAGVRRFRIFLEVPKCANISCAADCKYRSYDGTYNNLNHTNWGKSNTAFLRFLVPRYNGPGGEVARSVEDDSTLPNARWLSTQIFPDMDRPSPSKTLATMQWGQLLAHDMGLSPNSADNCCVNASRYADQCMSIEIPADDPFYSKYNQTCMNMMRSDSESVTFGCLSYPNQINSVTQYIDLSLVYGSNKTTALSLRQCKGGLLSTSSGPRVFLPLSSNPIIDCNVPSPNGTCYRAGDTRVNQNTQLTCLQTVLLREHNRMATKLAAINPHWGDERLYQETRAILIAVFQHISYKEWLPLIVGDSYMKKHSLYPLKSGYTYDYCSDVNPATANSFMTGAYRVFHSGIQGHLQMINTTTRCPFRSLNISDWMLKPGIITNNSNNFDELLLGLTVEPVQAIDRFFTTQMTEMMFHDNLPFGEDLESFDIQRGRDHGIPSYNVMRELCNLTKAKNFSDLIDVMEEEHVELLVDTYNNVDDIDYFVGGTLEKPAEDSAVGPSFLCLIGEQFVRKKISDRFWYENGHQPHSFTKAQLQEIRKSSFSRLLCDNGDNITHMQPNGFQYSTKKGNAVLPCSKIPALNLFKWADNSTTTTTVTTH